MGRGLHDVAGLSRLRLEGGAAAVPLPRHLRPPRRDDGRAVRTARCRPMRAFHAGLRRAGRYACGAGTGRRFHIARGRQTTAIWAIVLILSATTSAAWISRWPGRDSSASSFRPGIWCCTTTGRTSLPIRLGRRGCASTRLRPWSCGDATIRPPIEFGPRPEVDPIRRSQIDDHLAASGILRDLSRKLVDGSSAQTSATLLRKSDKRNALLPTLPRTAARSDVEVRNQMGIQAIPALGSRSVVVDVRIAAAITHVNR